MGTNTQESDAWRFDNSRAGNAGEKKRKDPERFSVKQKSGPEFPSYRTEDDDYVTEEYDRAGHSSDLDKKTLTDILVIGAGILTAFVIGGIVFVLAF